MLSPRGLRQLDDRLYLQTNRIDDGKEWWAPPDQRDRIALIRGEAAVAHKLLEHFLLIGRKISDFIEYLQLRAQRRQPLVPLLVISWHRDHIIAALNHRGYDLSTLRGIRRQRRPDPTRQAVPVRH